MVHGVSGSLVQQFFSSASGLDGLLKKLEGLPGGDLQKLCIKRGQAPD